MAYRVVNKKGKKVRQILVEWLGLDPDERSWEDVETIARLVPLTNLEAKVNSDGGRDVTIGLDLAVVLERLKADLSIEEQLQEEGATSTPITADTRDLQQTRLTKTRKVGHDPNFIYY